MDIRTQAVHSGDRKRPQSQIPVATPVHFAASWITEDQEEQDRIFGGEQKGYAYSRYANPTNDALEELITTLEGGAGSLACASGMAALQHAITVALLNRPKRVLCARDIYGATLKLLFDVLAPLGVESRVVDTCDPAAVEQAIGEFKPGCLLMETISNPLLRVGDLDALAGFCRQAGVALIVDNTFATPLLVRPLEHGASIVVHSSTKFLGGHGDTLGGLVTTTAEFLEDTRRLARINGPILGPMEAFLTMRGIKTFPLRLERQCENAKALAAWLRTHPRVERVYYPDDPAHPDARIIERLLAPGLRGAMVAFEIRGAGKSDVFSFLNGLRLIVKATSLGDLHSIVLYPWISSHRDVPVELKERMGVRENLVRVSVGIEHIGDIQADLENALS
jgi:cystathionine gamma-synthase/methionine-gamma-lyase